MPNYGQNASPSDLQGRKLESLIENKQIGVIRVRGIWKIGKSREINRALEALRRSGKIIHVCGQPPETIDHKAYDEISASSICNDIVERVGRKSKRMDSPETRLSSHFASSEFRSYDWIVICRHASKQALSSDAPEMLVPTNKHSNIRLIIEQRTDFAVTRRDIPDLWAHPWSAEDASSHIQTEINGLDAQVGECILKWVGRHPGLIKWTIPYDRIIQRVRNGSLSEDDVEAIIDSYMDQNHISFQRYYDELHFSLSRADQMALRNLLTDTAGLPERNNLQGLDDAGLLVTQENGRKAPVKFLQKFAQRSPEALPGTPGLTPPPVRLKISIESQEMQMKISCDGDVGQTNDSSPLPFDEKQLVAVLKALDPDRKAGFDESQKESLRTLGFWDTTDEHLRQNYRELVGVKLFEALFAGRIKEALERAEGKRQRGSISLELRFAHDEVLLARYPWELLYKQVPPGFMLRNHFDLVRYVTFLEALPTIRGESQCRLLYVRPRPTNLDFPENDSEHEIVWKTLLGEKAAKIAVNDCTIRTYSELQIVLENTKAPIHLIHFDGHGMFARMCECGEVNYAHSEKCEKCHASLNGTTPEGFLAFEKEGKCDLVKADDVSGLLSRNGDVRFVFLSACASAVVRGDSVFGGVAPRLIGSKVPAVVAMQSSITFEDTTKFAAAFYRNVASGKTIPEAVWSGRQTLRSNESWFVPTVYLRADDGDSGRLFDINEEG